MSGDCNVDWDAEGFKAELVHLVNRHSMENESNTPDYLLADYLMDCLHAYKRVHNRTNDWFGIKPWNKEVKKAVSPSDVVCPEGDIPDEVRRIAAELGEKEVHILSLSPEFEFKTTPGIGFPEPEPMIDEMTGEEFHPKK